MKKFFDGIYQVTISNVTYGESKIKKTPYFECRFEDGHRYIEDRVYITPATIFFRGMLYYKSCVNSTIYDGSNLIGARLFIEVISGEYIDKEGNKRTFGKIGKFYSEDEIADKEWKEFMYNEEFMSDAEVFGVDPEDVAEDLGVDISDVTSQNIREYCGY